jgi:hypothetical protein
LNSTEGEVVQSQPFAVNLFDPNEATSHRRQRQRGGPDHADDREGSAARILAGGGAAGAAALLVEWIVYHRRLQVRTVLSPVLQRRRVG